MSLAALRAHSIVAAAPLADAVEVTEQTATICPSRGVAFPVDVAHARMPYEVDLTRSPL